MFAAGLESGRCLTLSLIHIYHSDRGCQYASREYINTLMRYGISVSMTESGNPKDNAKACLLYTSVAVWYPDEEDMAKWQIYFSKRLLIGV